MSKVQAHSEPSSAARQALVAQYIRELAAPSTASGADEGSVGVIPNGARPAEAAP